MPVSQAFQRCVTGNQVFDLTKSSLFVLCVERLWIKSNQLTLEGYYERLCESSSFLFIFQMGKRPMLSKSVCVFFTFFLDALSVSFQCMCTWNITYFVHKTMWVVSVHLWFTIYSCHWSCMHACTEWKKNNSKSCSGSTFACVFPLLAEFGRLSTLTRVAILRTAEFRRVVRVAILSAVIGYEAFYNLWLVWNAKGLDMAVLECPEQHPCSFLCNRTLIICNSLCCYFFSLYSNIYSDLEVIQEYSRTLAQHSKHSFSG